MANGAQMIGEGCRSPEVVLRYRICELMLYLSRKGTLASLGVCQMTMPS